MNKFFCEECGQPIWAEDCPEGEEPTTCDDCAREFARADYEIDRRREEPELFYNPFRR